MLDFKLLIPKKTTHPSIQLTRENASELANTINDRGFAETVRLNPWGFEGYTPSRTTPGGLHMDSRFRQINYGHWLTFYDWGFSAEAPGRVDGHYDIEDYDGN